MANYCDEHAAMKGATEPAVTIRGAQGAGDVPVLCSMGCGRPATKSKMG